MKYYDAYAVLLILPDGRRNIIESNIKGITLAKQRRKYWAEITHLPTKLTPVKTKTNPRPRIGTRKATRASSTTGKRASKRLIARRKHNSRKGYFPNPRTAREMQRKIYARKHEPRGKIWVRSNKNIRRVAHRQVKYGSPYKFYVQVKRNDKWLTLGGFTIKENAIVYGKSMAAKFRSKTFRVAWK